MRPPSTYQWLIGNPIVSLVLMVGSLFALWQSATGAWGWPLGIAAAALGLSAYRAADRVNAYTAWRREWEGMGTRRSPTFSFAWLKPVGGFLLWLIGAVWAAQGADGDPYLRVGIILFWIGSAVMAVALMLRAVRKPSARTASTKNAIVAVCLPVPGRGSSVKDAYQATQEFW